LIAVFNPDLNILTRNPKKRYPIAKYPDPDGRGRVVVTENNVYDKATQINRIKWYFRIGKRKREIVENMHRNLTLCLNTMASKSSTNSETTKGSLSPRNLQCR
jgi:hypothetical protein